MVIIDSYSNMEQISNIVKEVGVEAISDAMTVFGIEGIIQGFIPTIEGKVICGSAYTVSYEKSDEKEKCIAGDFIDNVIPGSVIVIDNDNWDYCSVWGNILSRVAQRRKIAGTVINGAARDVETMKKMGYPLYSKSVTCRTGKGRVFLKAVQCPLVIDGVTVNPGDFVIAQNNIALIIPKANIIGIINKAVEIVKMENSIIQAVFEDGITLKEARRKYKYNSIK